MHIEVSMKIQKDSVVYLYYTLNAQEGKVFESSKDSHPMTYLHAHANILPALEAEFTAQKEGDQIRVNLTPEKA